MKAKHTSTATKRELQKEARRKEILEAGFDVFKEHGFTAARLDDVAEKAGIGKGTIYLYFDGKEALFEEVVRENLFPARDEAENLVAGFRGSASELLERHLKHIYSYMAGEKIPYLVAMVIGEVNRFPSLAEFFFHEMVSRNQEMMRTIIARGEASGEFRRTDVKQFCQILVAPILISAIWKLQFEHLEPLQMEAYADAHIDLILNGLKP